MEQELKPKSTELPCQTSTSEFPLTAKGNYDFTAIANSPSILQSLRGPSQQHSSQTPSRPGSEHGAEPQGTTYSFAKEMAAQAERAAAREISSLPLAAGLEGLVTPRLSSPPSPEQAQLPNSPSMSIGGIGGPSLPSGYGAYSDALRRGAVPPVVGAFGVDFDPRALQQQRIDEQKFRSRFPFLASSLTDADCQRLKMFHDSLSQGHYGANFIRELVRRAAEPITSVRCGHHASTSRHAAVTGIEYDDRADQVRVGFARS